MTGETREEVRCTLCGELMPPGEEMFNFHGYSGPCPKPPMAFQKGSASEAHEEDGEICPLCDGLTHEECSGMVFKELVAMREENSKLRASRDALARVGAFVRDALDAHCSGRWWQDSDMQDKLEEHGLLAPVVVSEPCNRTHCECSAGDTCYRLTPLALQVRALDAGAGG